MEKTSFSSHLVLANALYLTSTRAACIDILSQLEEMPDDIDNFTRTFMYSTELDDLSDKFMEQAKSSHEHIQ